MAKLYTAAAVSTGGRGGHIKTSDGLLDLELRTPKEMGGPGGAYSNPEMLFAATYAACFNGAMMAVAANKRPILGSVVTANVSFNNDQVKGFFISVEMDVNIPDMTQAEAEQVVADAHQMCPYSKATRGNVEVTFNVSVK
jgi:Ohr subfamily peroxiredoxin